MSSASKSAPATRARLPTGALWRVGIVPKNLANVSHRHPLASDEAGRS